MHVVEFASLFYVCSLHAKEGQVKARSKRYPLGGGSIDCKPHFVKWTTIFLDNRNGCHTPNLYFQRLENPVKRSRIAC